ncbi:MAG: restriction endonuclease subunit S [Solirubrobacteraceae bacterium]
MTAHERVKLGEAVSNRNDFVSDIKSRHDRLVAGEHIDEGALAIRRWAFTDDELVPPTFNRRFHAGDVLLHSRNVRKLAVPRFDGVTGEKLFILHPANGHIVDSDFIVGLLLSDAFERHLARSVRGSVNKFLNWKQLAAFDFALPTPDAQRRVAEAFRATQRVLDALASAGNDLTTVRAVLRKRHFREAGWPMVPVGEVAAVRNGTTPRRKEPGYWGGDIPWLPTGKVHDRRIGVADEHITRRALAECSLSIVPAGSVLVAMIGQGKTRGSAAYLEIDATTNQNFASVTPGPSLDGEFLFHALSASYGGLRRASQGSNQGALNCRLVAAFSVPLPQLPVQRKVARQLNAVDGALDEVAAHIESTRDLQRRALSKLLERTQ